MVAKPLASSCGWVTAKLTSGRIKPHPHPIAALEPTTPDDSSSSDNGCEVRLYWRGYLSRAMWKFAGSAPKDSEQHPEYVCSWCNIIMTCKEIIQLFAGYLLTPEAVVSAKCAERCSNVADFVSNRKVGICTKKQWPGFALS